MHNKPALIAMTATSGIQIRASHVLPTERGLTRSPFGTECGTRCLAPHTNFRAGTISTQSYVNQVDMKGRAEITSNGSLREPDVCGRYHLSVTSSAQTIPSVDPRRLNGVCCKSCKRGMALTGAQENLELVFVSSNVPQTPFQPGGGEYPSGEVGGGQHGNHPEESPLRRLCSMEMFKTPEHVKASEHE